jgi:hypothetical protein
MATKGSRKRTGACTRETAQKRIDGLMAERLKCGIVNELWPRAQSAEHLQLG